MACVKSVSYSILLKCVPLVPVTCKKGLRQWDPLSPFIFALSMKYLSRCISVMSKNPDFNFYPKCERINLVHLMFAVDLFMFARADHSSIGKIMDASISFQGLQALKLVMKKVASISQE